MTLTFEQRVYARLLRCGPDAVAGPSATLALLGVEGFDPRDRIDVVILRDRELRVPDHRHLEIPKCDRARHRKVIPVLSATRALIEAAPQIPYKRLRTAFDDALRKRLLTVDHARRRATELSDHPGSTRLLEFLSGDAGAAETEGERPMQVFLRAALPDEVIEWQVDDLVPGRRLDAAVRRVLVGFEYDGREFHVDREADYRRDLACGTEGVHIIRITAGMLRHHSDETREGIRAIIAQRSRLLAAGPR